MGNIRIACDQQLRDIINQEEDIFERNYKYAHVDLIYLNESSVFKYLKDDSVKTAITCRSFSPAEIAYFNTKQINPRMYPLAKGAIALLSNKASRDSTITYEEFIGLCLDSNNTESDFKKVIIEDAASGIAHYLLNKSRATSFSKNVFTLKSKADLFEYLKQDLQAIAVVDWTDFSDSDNSIQQKKLEGYKVLAITQPKDSMNDEFILPDQYELQDEKYPLTRTYYMLSVSGKDDLGLGFASFITGEIGQRIMLKAGLLPLYQSERWVELKY